MWEELEFVEGRKGIGSIVYKICVSKGEDLGSVQGGGEDYDLRKGDFSAVEGGGRMKKGLTCL